MSLFWLTLCRVVWSLQMQQIELLVDDDCLCRRLSVPEKMAVLCWRRSFDGWGMLDTNKALSARVAQWSRLAVRTAVGLLRLSVCPSISAHVSVRRPASQHAAKHPKFWGKSCKLKINPMNHRHFCLYFVTCITAFQEFGQEWTLLLDLNRP